MALAATAQLTIPADVLSISASAIDIEASPSSLTDIQSSSKLNLSTLPLPLLLNLLVNIPDLRTLTSLLLTHRIFYPLFTTYRHTVLSNVLRSEVPSSAIEFLATVRRMGHAKRECVLRRIREGGLLTSEERRGEAERSMLAVLREDWDSGGRSEWDIYNSTLTPSELSFLLTHRARSDSFFSSLTLFLHSLHPSVNLLDHRAFLLLPVSTLASMSTIKTFRPSALKRAARQYYEWWSANEVWHWKFWEWLQGLEWRERDYWVKFSGGCRERFERWEKEGGFDR